MFLGDIMGFNYRKSIKLGKGFKVNISKRGIGISAGVKGYRVSVGSKGIRKTVSIPGTGIYSTTQKSWNQLKNENKVDIKNNTDNVKKKAEIKPKNPIPFDFVKPKMNRLLYYIDIAFFILLLLSFKYPLLIFLVFIDTFLIFRNKKYANLNKSYFLMQNAINAYQRYDFDKCRKYCNKVLKLGENVESAQSLIKYIDY
jgi:hypothetical protein